VVRLGQPGPPAFTHLSARACATELNKRGIEAPNGGQWFAMQVVRVRDRVARRDVSGEGQA